MRVLFDYTAKQPNELSIKVGEILEVVARDVEEGWWEVCVCLCVYACVHVCVWFMCVCVCMVYVCVCVFGREN